MFQPNVLFEAFTNYRSYRESRSTIYNEEAIVSNFYIYLQDEQDRQDTISSLSCKNILFRDIPSSEFAIYSDDCCLHLDH
jgi:hypothetical protein